MVNTFPNANSFSDFGGLKVDYSAVVNVNTDYSADNMDTLGACVSGMSRVANRGYVRFTGGSSPTITSFNNGWKSQTATIPLIVHSGTGVYLMTLPSSVNDALGNPVFLNLQYAQSSIEGTTFGFSQANINSANTITINTANSSASPNDLSGSVIVVVFA